VFDGYIKLTVKTEKMTRSIAGTCFSDGKPRFIQIKGINLDAEVGAHMLYTTNADVPGIIGLLGTLCGENDVNIANFIATPHLGASTTEAQENVALQVAEQMSDYLIKGAVTNAINMPSITAEEAPRLKPFVKLAEVLGAFVGQVTEDPITEVEILFDGSTATMNTRALISAALAGLIRPQVSDVNMVSAPIMVKERGIIVAEVKRDKSGVFDGYIKLTVKTEHMTRSIAGTCFSDGKPRFIQIKGINLDAEVGQHMLYTTNADAPGIIGLLGTVCGENGVNIANFQLGRNRPGGDAIALLYLDAPFPENVLAEVRAHKAIDSAKRLQFDV
jgi:D-3-phosphoglycerate dehydrogenase